MNFKTIPVMVDTNPSNPIGGPTPPSTPPSSPPPPPPPPADPPPNPPSTPPADPPLPPSTPPADPPPGTPPNPPSTPPADPPPGTPPSTPPNTPPADDKEKEQIEMYKGYTREALEAVLQQQKGWIPADVKIEPTLKYDEYEKLLEQGYQARLAKDVETEKARIQKASDLVDFMLSGGTKETIEHLIPVERLLSLNPQMEGVKLHVVESFHKLREMPETQSKIILDVVKNDAAKLEESYKEAIASLGAYKTHVIEEDNKNKAQRERDTQLRQQAERDEFVSNINKQMSKKEIAGVAITDELRTKIKDAFFGLPAHTIETKGEDGKPIQAKVSFHQKVMWEVINNPEIQFAYVLQRLNGSLLPTELRDNITAKVVRELLNGANAEIVHHQGPVHLGGNPPGPTKVVPANVKFVQA